MANKPTSMSNDVKLLSLFPAYEEGKTGNALVCPRLPLSFISSSSMTFKITKEGYFKLKDFDLNKLFRPTKKKRF